MRRRKQYNPHAELCAWANGLRPDSPQYEKTEDNADQDADYDGAPYCSYCKARTAAGCNCGPIADNE